MPSSVQVFNQAISDFQRLQGLLTTKQSKISSDSKASTFAELGDDITAVQGYSLSSNRASRFIETIQDAQRKNDTYAAAISQIIDIAQQFKQNLSIENSSGTSQVNDLTSQANAALDNIRGALNQKYGPNYVFSGSKTNVEPVDDLKYNTNFIDGGPTASYYNGDDFTQSVDVSSTQRVDYGITASNQAFKDLIGAINLAKDQEAVNGSYEQASNLLDKALSELSTLQAQNGNNGSLFQSSVDLQQSAKQTFDEKYSDLNSPDVVQLTIETSQIQATLQASFMVFSKISALSLTNYLQ